MAEQDQSTSHGSDPQHLDEADPASNGKDVKEDGTRREVRGGIANERDVSLVETGQQPLEMSTTGSQQDPKLVHLHCLSFFAEETNQEYR